MLPIEHLEWCLKHGEDLPLAIWMDAWDLTPAQARDIIYAWLQQQGVLR